jgi:hypothetical protein
MRMQARSRRCLITRSQDHRKHGRFEAPSGVLVGVGPDFEKIGRLKDLDMEGLAFRYFGDVGTLAGSYVELFMTSGDFYLGKLPIETVADLEVVGKMIPDPEKLFGGSKRLRQCSVKFKRLTPEQKDRLQAFINSHTAGEG